jgi:hypothetical protein
MGCPCCKFRKEIRPIDRKPNYFDSTSTDNNANQQTYCAPTNSKTRPNEIALEDINPVTSNEPTTSAVTTSAEYKMSTIESNNSHRSKSNEALTSHTDSTSPRSQQKKNRARNSTTLNGNDYLKDYTLSLVFIRFL